VGLKERAGQVTSQLAIRVYVRRKRQLDQVSLAERIPSEIDGIPTDVNTVGAYGFTSDNTRYRPIFGGIPISNRIIDSNEALTGTQVQVGTLGCIATLNSDRSPVLLSNWHVLMANSAHIDDSVYQPGPASIPPVDLADLPLRLTDDADVIGKIAKYAISAKADAAVARIDVSSCCHCCGIDYRDEVHELSAGGRPPANAIVGQRPAAAGMTVYKRGMQSLRTTGHVVDSDFPSFDITSHGQTYTFTGQIQIACDDPVARFSGHGDSGSVVVDGDGYIVGLLFATDSSNPPDSRSMANHISDVCTELGISVNFASSLHTVSALTRAPSAPLAAPDAVAEAHRAVRERLLRRPAGAHLLELAEEHSAEIAELVDRNRRVTIAWHRVHGPAFVAAALNTLRAGGDAIPASVGGVSLEMMLERVGAALAANGSARLRNVIEAHGPVLLDAVHGSATFEEVLDSLSATPFADDLARVSPRDDSGGRSPGEPGLTGPAGGGRE
jgi:hypothetical protein